MAKFQDKERILKAARGKQEVTYKGAPIRLATDFSGNAPSQKRMAKSIPSNENQRPATKTTFYPVRLSIKTEGQIKSFPDNRSLKEYTSTKPVLQEMLNGLLYGKEGKERERDTHTQRNTRMKKWQ